MKRHEQKVTQENKDLTSTTGDMHQCLQELNVEMVSWPDKKKPFV
jgi:hypothetical protein